MAAQGSSPAAGALLAHRPREGCSASQPQPGCMLEIVLAAVHGSHWQRPAGMGSTSLLLGIRAPKRAAWLTAHKQPLQSSPKSSHLQQAVLSHVAAAPVNPWQQSRTRSVQEEAAEVKVQLCLHVQVQGSPRLPCLYQNLQHAPQAVLIVLVRSQAAQAGSSHLRACKFSPGLLLHLHTFQLALQARPIVLAGLQAAQLCVGMNRGQIGSYPCQQRLKCCGLAEHTVLQKLGRPDAPHTPDLRPSAALASKGLHWLPLPRSKPAARGSSALAQASIQADRLQSWPAQEQAMTPDT